MFQTTAQGLADSTGLPLDLAGYFLVIMAEYSVAKIVEKREDGDLWEVPTEFTATFKKRFQGSTTAR